MSENFVKSMVEKRWVEKVWVKPLCENFVRSKGEKIGEKVWVKKDGWKRYGWKLCRSMGENFVTSMGEKKVYVKTL